MLSQVIRLLLLGELINAIVAECGKKADKFQITRPDLSAGGGIGLGGMNYYGGGFSSGWSPWDFADWVDSITTEDQDKSHVIVTGCANCKP